MTPTDEPADGILIRMTSHLYLSRNADGESNWLPRLGGLEKKRILAHKGWQERRKLSPVLIVAVASAG